MMALFVEKDEVICEIESDKATFELTAEATGRLEHVAQEGDILEIGGLICKIAVTEGGKPQSKTNVESAGSSSTDSTPQAAGGSANGNSSYASGHASPAAAKILAEKGIDASQRKRHRC